ncbi:MAG: hypothetical protein PHE77_03950 [Candidatus Pacebacteria bacterium]|nr:hypothetical protein [Candidatus Paceibacterota bacterium]
MADVSYLQKEADRLMKIPGTQKGETIQSLAKYIEKHSGEDGLSKIKQALIDLGYPIDFEAAHKMHEYPDARNALVVLLCKELLNYTDEDIFNMGYEMSKMSLIDQFFMKTFVSIDRMAKNAPAYWKKHLSVGEIETYEFNKKEKYFILRLSNYAFHPVVCLSIAGYFLGLMHYVQPSATIKETKCIHRGDPYHEFKVSW